MLGLKGLSRRVALSLAISALAGLAITTIGWMVLYAVFDDTAHGTATDAWRVHLIDYAAVAVFAGLGLAWAVGTAMRISGRIVRPVKDIAAAARRIADGDLSARADETDLVLQGADGDLDEIADLVRDFNHMAGRLEKLAGDAIQWNAAVAHELRTPLTILRGHLQGAADGVFELDGALLAGLITQVEGLSRLVDDLRIISMADTGRLLLQLEPTSLDGIVEEMRALMDAPMRQSGFTPEWKAEPLWVWGDGARLRQALLALLENVRQHATPGRLTVEVFQDAQAAVLRVSDSGPGLPDEAQAFIFEPFQRVDNNARNGSGLGLAVVRGVAEAHGGVARLGTPRHGGATFEIAIPLPDGRADAITAPTYGHRIRTGETV